MTACVAAVHNTGDDASTAIKVTTPSLNNTAPWFGNRRAGVTHTLRS